MVKKMKIDSRDQDSRRKKDLEEIEKMKEEEMEKIRKEKKGLE